MIPLPGNIFRHHHEFSPESGKEVSKWRLELAKMFGNLHHNSAFLKAVGYHEGNLIGQRLLDFCPQLIAGRPAMRISSHHLRVTVECFLDERGGSSAPSLSSSRARAMARHVNLTRTDTVPKVVEAFEFAREKTRRIAVDHHAVAMAAASKTSNLRLRSLPPPTGHVSTCLDVAKAELKTVILAG
jgi:hypothetical protein